jgi:hypothetical protein
MCSFVLETGFICCEAFSSAEAVEIHFKNHLWEEKPTLNHKEASQADEATCSEIGEFAPCFFVGGLE